MYRIRFQTSGRLGVHPWGLQAGPEGRPHKASTHALLRLPVAPTAQPPATTVPARA